jgi:hypothetical protein
MLARLVLQGSCHPQFGLNSNQPGVQEFFDLSIIDIFTIDVNADVGVMVINVTLKVQIDAVLFSVHGVACVSCAREGNLRFY